MVLIRLITGNSLAKKSTSPQKRVRPQAVSISKDRIICNTPHTFNVERKIKLSGTRDSDSYMSIKPRSGSTVRRSDQTLTKIYSKLIQKEALQDKENIPNLDLRKRFSVVVKQDSSYASTRVSRTRRDSNTAIFRTVDEKQKCPSHNNIFKEINLSNSELLDSDVQELHSILMNIEKLKCELM